jgi:hypothetical protein
MMVKVAIKAIVGEDRHLTFAVPEEIPVGPVLVTITPLREGSDEDDDEYIQLPPGAPDISRLIEEGRREW